MNRTGPEINGSLAGKDKPRHKIGLTTFVWLALWSALMLSFWIQNGSHNHALIIELAETEARANFNKDPD